LEWREKFCDIRATVKRRKAQMRLNLDIGGGIQINVMLKGRKLRREGLSLRGRV
jgi:hypothetical protein